MQGSVEDCAIVLLTDDESGGARGRCGGDKVLAFGVVEREPPDSVEPERFAWKGKKTLPLPLPLLQIFACQRSVTRSCASSSLYVHQKLRNVVNALLVCLCVCV